MELRVNFDDLYQVLGGTRPASTGLLNDDPVADQARSILAYGPSYFKWVDDETGKVLRDFSFEEIPIDLDFGSASAIVEEFEYAKEMAEEVTGLARDYLRKLEGL